jgi:hypothetical protein
LDKNFCLELIGYIEKHQFDLIDYDRLQSAGKKVGLEEVYSDVAGKIFTPESTEFAIVAKKS